MISSGQRIVLRPHSEANFERLHAWRNDVELQELSSPSVSSYTEEQTRDTLARWMRRDRTDIIHFAIHLAVTQQIIGFLHIAMIEPEHMRCRIGIVVGERHLWGRGYGSESLRCALDYCFDELDMNRVSAETYASNPRSAALLEKVGFVREGTMRESVRKNGEFVDEYQYGLLRSDWLQPRSGGKKKD